MQVVKTRGSSRGPSGLRLEWVSVALGVGLARLNFTRPGPNTRGSRLTVLVRSHQRVAAPPTRPLANSNVHQTRRQRPTVAQV